MKDTRTVRLAPAEGGGLYPIVDEGGENAPNVCVVFCPSNSEIRRALSIFRRRFPAYKYDGAEVRIYGTIKQTKGTK